MTVPTPQPSIDQQRQVVRSNLPAYLPQTAHTLRRQLGSVTFSGLEVPEEVRVAVALTVAWAEGVARQVKTERAARTSFKGVGS